MIFEEDTGCNSCPFLVDKYCLNDNRIILDCPNRNLEELEERIFLGIYKQENNTSQKQKG